MTNNNFMIRIEFVAGTDIETSIKQALIFQEKMKETVIYNFNGIEVIVTGNKNEKEIYDAYKNDLKFKRYIQVEDK